MSAKTRLGELLVDGGVLTRGQLGDALRYQEQAGGRLGTNLLELGLVDEKTLAAALAKQFSITSVTAAQLDNVPAEVLRLVPGPLAARLSVMPIRFDAGRLWLAMSNPADADAVDEITRLTKKPVRVTVAPDLAIQMALEKHYKVPRRPRQKVAAQSYDIDLDAPLYTAPSPIAHEDVMELDEADVATGFLDDEHRPARTQSLPGMTMTELVGQLAVAGADEVVLDLVVRYLSPMTVRLCVLMLRNGELSGWRGNNVDDLALAQTRVAPAKLPLLQRALEQGQAWVGRVGPLALGVLAGPLNLTGEVLGLVVPVRVAKTPLGVILGLDVSRDVMQRKSELDKLAIKIDHALHLNHLKRLLLAP
jgi:hypothetical protein